MIEFLYVSGLFTNWEEKVEGSFSSGRAAAQLRQFYMRMVDTDDEKKTKKHWEKHKKRYVAYANELAQEYRDYKIKEQKWLWWLAQ